MNNSPKPTVGVIGGMGPAATLDFVNTVMTLSGAVRDEEHMPMLIDNNTQIPNRQAAIRGDGPSPGPAIAATGKRLEQAGADFLVMPCNTAHAFIDELLDSVSIPFLSIIDSTIAATSPSQRVGILSTAGCLAFGGYQRALSENGSEPVIPAGGEVEELSELVLRIKSGDTGDEVCQSMTGLFHSLHESGCEAIISACTEIPVVLDTATLPCPLICSTRELALATLKHASTTR